MTDVSVIIPTYNEHATIIDAVAGARYALPSYSVEILVVDDDSPDGTAARVDVEYSEDDRVRVIRRSERGLASAVVRGFREATGGTLAVMDGDLQHPPSQLGRLVVPVAAGHADVAVGSRHTTGGAVAADWPRWRRAVSQGATLLAQAAVPQARALSDPMSGFFAVRADVVQGMLDQLDPCGYKILLELLARCPVDSVHEAGYTFEPREHGASNLGPREYAQYVEHLARLVVPSRQPISGSPLPAAEVADE